jgi:hypothetical protein
MLIVGFDPTGGARQLTDSFNRQAPTAFATPAFAITNQCVRVATEK